MRDRKARKEWLYKTYTFYCECELCSAESEKDAASMANSFDNKHRCRGETCTGLLVPKDGLERGVCAMCGKES